jgi:hypothetical protein
MGAAAWTMACLLTVANAGPNTGPVETFYINHRAFQVPIGIADPKLPAHIKEILLYVAEPGGKDWHITGRATPPKDSFEYRASDDGAYWFRMSVIDVETGKENASLPRLIVVDTVKPLLRLQSAERQGDEVLVRWELIEKNPNWASLKLEYLPSDAPGALWSSVKVAAPESGQATFHVDGPVVAVRMSVADLAKNESIPVELPVKNGGMGVAAAGGTGLPPLTDNATAPGPLPPPVADRGWSPTPPGAAVVPRAPGRTAADTPDAGRSGRPSVVAAAATEAGGVAAPVATPPRTPRGPLPPVQMVKKRQVTIDYEVTKYGPSGIKSVELYVTRDDGRTWQRCDGEDNITVPLPGDGRGALASFKRSLTVELQADGLYGFYLVVRSGAGLGKPPPQSGVDAPQIRIEVDTTAPKADLFEPRPHPTRRDSLVLNWTASDNKLGPTPITLQWAERPDGDWQTIGGNELPNTGEYVWQVPANVPPHVFLRLLVRDLAGNESVAQTAQPILVDLNEPEVKPLQITAGAR